MLIRYSAPNEVDISGTGEGWANWRKQLLEMLGSRGDKVTLKATEHGDPSPYDACLLSLDVLRRATRIRFSVANDRLVLEADEERLRNFADNLPWDAEDPSSGIQYHVHYDRLGYSDWFEDDSLDIVLTKTQKAEHQHGEGR